MSGEKKTPPEHALPSTMITMDPARGFEMALPATVRGLKGVRRRFRDWMGGVVVDDAVRSDLVLVVSEMCSTAVRAARGKRGRSSPMVHAWLEGAAIVIEVRDAGASPVERSMHDPDEVASSRALSIVAAVADVLTVRAEEHEMLWRVRKEGVAGDGDRSFAGTR